MGRLRVCPVPGCETKHSRNLMMCKPHWFQVPKPIRDEVWRSFKGEGVLSDTYLDAREAAIGSVSP